MLEPCSRLFEQRDHGKDGRRAEVLRQIAFETDPTTLAELGNLLAFVFCLRFKSMLTTLGVCLKSPLRRKVARHG